MGLFGLGKGGEARSKIPGRPSVSDMMRAAGGDGDAMRRLMEQGEQMRAAYMDEARAAAADPTSANDPRRAWLAHIADVLAPAQSGFVRRSDCAKCGATKKLPSRTAFIYCDYCGSLVDYDLHKVVNDDPGPAFDFVSHTASLDRQAKEAVQRGDEAAYLACQSQKWAAYVQDMPSAVSHRTVGDEAYRAGLIEYMARGATARAFDPGSQQLQRELVGATSGLRWIVPGRQVDAASFNGMVEVLGRQLAYEQTMLEGRGILAIDPDKADGPLRGRLEWSTIAQAWLQFLEPEAARTFLAERDLAAEFVPVQTDGAQDRTCSGCGGQIKVLPGAKVVVCDGCGRSNDVGGGTVECGGCGGTVTLAAGAVVTSCPHCGAELDRVGR